MTPYRITGLAPEPFLELYGLDDAELAARGAKRYIVDKTPGFPDRIEMRDLKLGERAILVNYTHQPANTPYRSSHAIFVGEGRNPALRSRERNPRHNENAPIKPARFRR